MDFENVTDTEPVLNIPQSQDPFIAPEDTGVFPKIEEPVDPKATTTNVDDIGGKKTIAILLVSVFVTLTIGSIVAYVLITSTQSKNTAQTAANPYDKYKNIPTPSPKPTTPIQTRAVVPAASEEAKTEPSASPTPEILTDWKIVFDQPVLSLSDLDIKTNTIINARLFGPLTQGEDVCVENNRNDYMYFNRKKSDKIYEPVCRQEEDLNSARFNCYQYDQAEGVQISEPLLPVTNCTDDGQIEAGYYALFTKVFYNCKIAGKPAKSITETDCEDSYDLTSDDLTVDN